MNKFFLGMVLMVLTLPAWSAPEDINLAKKSGCLACHKIDKKVVGPAWQDVAKRYKDDNDAEKKLFEKIKKGGKGNWTKVTGGAPMPPFKHLADEKVQRLVSFILSLAP